MPPETTSPSPKRIVVTGARGYIGSRLVPELLRQGHDVVATASSDPAGSPLPWVDDVEWAVMDALDAGDVAAAVKGADAVCYLVHALDKPGFSDLDRQAADIMREAVDAAEVPRLVYLSGLVPDLPHDELSTTCPPGWRSRRSCCAAGPPPPRCAPASCSVRARPRSRSSASSRRRCSCSRCRRG